MTLFIPAVILLLTVCPQCAWGRGAEGAGGEGPLPSRSSRHAHCTEVEARASCQLGKPGKAPQRRWHLSWAGRSKETGGEVGRDVSGSLLGWLECV